MATVFKVGLITTMGLTATYLVGKAHPTRVELGLLLALGLFIVLSIFAIPTESKRVYVYVEEEYEPEEEEVAIEGTPTEDTYLASFRAATNEGMLPSAPVPRNYVREDAYEASLGGY